jgi:uncharacterized protein YjbI with pentapeptide repeats
MEFVKEDLAGRDFSGTDLAGARFSNCTLEGASFRHADLTGATLERCRAFSNDQTDAPAVVDFGHANLSEAVLSFCDFTTGNFARARAYDLTMEDCQLQGADLSYCDFSLPIQGAAALARFTMHRCNFSFGDLSNTFLRNCTLTENRMIDALLDHCDLSGADLSGSDLNGASGAGLLLEGADLRRASFNTLDPRRVSLASVTMGLPQGLQILQTLGILVDPDGD